MCSRKEIYWLINISSLNVFTPKRLQEMDDNNWYFSKMHIVTDKRWFGRYVFIKFTKNIEENFMTFNKKTF